MLSCISWIAAQERSKISRPTENKAMAVGGRERETASVWGNKSLYICTTESKLDFRTRYAIHSIKLSDLLSLDEKRDDTFKGDHSDASKSKFKSKSKSNSCGGLQKVVSIYNEHVPRGMSCGVFGSQILFAGGTNFRPSGQEISKKIYVFETDPTVDPNPSLKEFEPGFLESKGEPFLVELEGNLYALSGIYEGSPTFEVFSKRSRFWFPKHDPPFFEGYFCCGGCHTYLSIAVAGTKILVSCPKNPKVFCFDVAKHRYLGEWTILSGSDCGLPFVGKTLVLDLDDTSDDKVLFTYQFIHSNVRKDNSEDWGIVPYRMSINDAESSISIKLSTPSKLNICGELWCLLNFGV